MTEYCFEELSSADLVVDAIYKSTPDGQLGGEPISRLMRGADGRGVGNMGGFRYAGKREPGYDFVILYSTGETIDWPDHLDRETGQFTYFGDNRTPGQELHETPKKGNLLLRDVFTSKHSGERESPPFFLFEQAGNARDVRFLGLAAPGGNGLTPNEDLTAVWRTTGGKRFQNYKSIFTVLDIGTINRKWLDELYDGNQLGEYCPEVWRKWKKSGRYSPLEAPSTVNFRSKEEQLPSSESDREILDAILQYFDPISFESFAAQIWTMIEPSAKITEITRPSRDGGRDAIGYHSLGLGEDRVKVNFALEAKFNKPSNGVGVKGVSRLISRLLHRQYGVLVTTSYLGEQPYKEIRNDGHPVVVVSGKDIVETLKRHGYGTEKAVLRWLEEDFDRGS